MYSDLKLDNKYRVINCNNPLPSKRPKTASGAVLAGGAPAAGGTHLKIRRLRAAAPCGAGALRGARRCRWSDEESDEEVDEDEDEEEGEDEEEEEGATGSGGAGVCGAAAPADVAGGAPGNPA